MYKRQIQKMTELQKNFLETKKRKVKAKVMEAESASKVMDDELVEEQNGMN